MKIYNPFDSMNFSYDRCFMCGIELNNENKTIEHIFPKWLQNEFNLWDQSIILLNQTKFFYRNLIIPCCKKCNNEYLNKLIEKPIEIAVKSGYDTFIKLDETLIFKWLVKLSYGMLFKELSLKVDVRNPSKGKIIEEDDLKKFKTLFLFLQSIRFKTEFHGEKPWSIMIFKVKKHPEKKNYHGMDMIFTNNYFLILNDIGIIASLQDNNVQKQMFDQHYLHLYEKELHEIQFFEICAKVFYKSFLMKRIPKYTIGLPDNESDKMWIISHSISGEIFDVWDQKEYAQHLEFFLKPWGIAFSELYVDDNNVMTFLQNEDGLFKDVDYE